MMRPEGKDNSAQGVYVFNVVIRPEGAREHSPGFTLG
jgi:hypothetical protein